MTSAQPITFKSSANYYDGRRHILGNVDCEVQNGRLIVQGDLRGEVVQILLRDVTGIEPTAGLLNKQVAITTPAASLVLFCKSREEVRRLTAMLQQLIMDWA